ncbi:hypothetical protein ACFL5V_03325 [Fibrobacterota bacterium]
MSTKQKYSFKSSVYITIFGTDTAWGKRFDIILLWSILFSVLVVILESVAALETRITEFPGVGIYLYIHD